MKYIAMLAAVLVCSITLTPAFSDDGGDFSGNDQGGGQQGDNWQGDQNNQNDQGDQNDGESFGGYSNVNMGFGESNSTMEFGESNRTMFFDDSNRTGIGDNMSDYVHHRNGLEKQMRDEIHSALKECMQNARQSGNRTAVMQCRDEIKSLQQEYRSYVSQQNLQFRQFREAVLSQDAGISQEQNAHSLYSVMDNMSSLQGGTTFHGNPHGTGVHPHGQGNARGHGPRGRSGH